MLSFARGLLNGCSDEKTSEKYIDKANVAYESGDYNKAIELFTKACDGGEVKGCYFLGLSYKEGDHVAQNDTKAIELFTKACDGGEAGGCGSLGSMYNNGEIVAQNYTKAVELFTKACDGGHTVGCNNLGVSYHEGKGVVQNDTKAIELFTKACNGGDELGCNNLKNMQLKSMDIQCVSACKIAMNTLIGLGMQIENPQKWLENCWEEDHCFR